MILKRKDIQVGSPHHWSPDVGAHIALQVITIDTIIIIFTRPLPAFGRHGLAGSSGGDQSGRINSSHSIIEELALGLDGIVRW